MARMKSREGRRKPNTAQPSLSEKPKREVIANSKDDDVVGLAGRRAKNIAKNGIWYCTTAKWYEMLCKTCK